MQITVEMLNEMVNAGIMTTEAAGTAIMKIQEEKLMKQNIIAPQITQHERKGKLQFICNIPAKYSRDGKRHQVTATTEEECKKKWLDAVSDAVENGTSTAPVTLSDLMQEWMEKKQDVKKQTLAGYHSHYENHIKNASFGKLKITEIRLQDCKNIIADLINHREKTKDGEVVGLGYNTIRHIRSEISMALDYAISMGYITVNYMTTVKINQGLCDKTRTRESKAWSDAELQTLHRAAVEEWNKNKKYRYSAVLMAMIFTGCRAGEFCSLEWKDFDAKRKTLTVSKTLTSYRDYEAGVHVQGMSTPKTEGSARVIRLTDEAVFWLNEIKRRQVEYGILTPYVVSSKTGKIANQRDLNMRFKIFCKAAGVDYNPTHACRRSYASVLIDGGIPVSEVARDLGHKKITTTMDSYYKPRAGAGITKQKSGIFAAATGTGIVAATGARVTTVTTPETTPQTRVK